jgi:prepilin-type N-terminal cleavage/methylation domain-containing protein/prepilin-type processing-associated H-X9-DG protein
MQNFESVARRRTSAFTLIELLVVIAIIALLAAIMFPVFSRAREQARKSSCQSNLRQVGLAIYQYVQDYDEKYTIMDLYPTANTGGRWYDLIQPYAKSRQVFACPTSGPVLANSSYCWNFTGTRPLTGAVGNGFGYRPTQFKTPSGTGVLSMSGVEQPTDTILLTDPSSNGYGGNGLSAVGYLTTDYMPVLHGGKPYSATAATVTDFSGGGNYLFADGHVKFLQAARTWRSAMWNVNKNDTTGVMQP